MAVWILFKDGKTGCAESLEAAQKLGTVEQCWSLPYAASPRLHTFSEPSFCFSPEMCKGRTSCPRSYACSE